MRIRMDLVQAAVEYSSFENLKKLERNRIKESGKTDDPEAYKARKGKVGNYGQYLDESDIAYIDEGIATRECNFLY